MLFFHSVQLNDQLQKKDVNQQKKSEYFWISLLSLILEQQQNLNILYSLICNCQLIIEIVVRQRSKICYFVEIVLEFEDVENLQSTLLVSRQITETQGKYI